MDRKQRFLYEEWLAVIFMWLAAFYIYYFIVFWGPKDFITNGPIQSYLNTSYVHIELILQALIFGILFNIINEISNRTVLSKKSFGSIIVTKSLLYILAIFIAGSLVYLVFDVFDIQEVKNSELVRVTLNPRYLFSLFMYLLFSIITINFVLQINRKFGPGNLMRMLMGRYHKPREENRIFLFLDLRDSTTLAEKLGHIKYSTLLRQCFHDLTDIIIKYRSEVYQFVGDEVVLSWKVDLGIKTLNCIKTFYAFEKKLEAKKSFYMNKFNIYPEFRGGMDVGVVTVSEIGDIKREIAYHGDVLNTAARLQEQCKKYGKKLLVSEHLTDRLKNLNGFIIDQIGELQLRGKSEKIKVFGIDVRDF